jgi:hypothetical protein
MTALPDAGPGIRRQDFRISGFRPEPLERVAALWPLSAPSRPFPGWPTLPPPETTRGALGTPWNVVGIVRRGSVPGGLKGSSGISHRGYLRDETERLLATRSERLQNRLPTRIFKTQRHTVHKSCQSRRPWFESAPGSQYSHTMSRREVAFSFAAG